VTFEILYLSPRLQTTIHRTTKGVPHKIRKSIAKLESSTTTKQANKNNNAEQASWISISSFSKPKRRNIGMTMMP
jgi:hypothetical protein